MNPNPNESGKPSTPPAAKRGHKPILPYGWEPRISNSYPDRVYYFNKFTGSSVWDLPPKLLDSSASKSSGSPSSVNSKSSDIAVSKPVIAGNGPKIPGKSVPKGTSPLKRHDSTVQLKKVPLKQEQSPAKLKKSPVKAKELSSEQTVSKAMPSELPSKRKITPPKVTPILKSSLKSKNRAHVKIKRNHVVISTVPTKVSPLKRKMFENSTTTGSFDDQFNKNSIAGVPDTESKTSASASPQTLNSFDAENNHNPDNDPCSDMDVEFPDSEDEKTPSNDLSNVDDDIEMIDMTLLENFLEPHKADIANALHIVVDTNVLIHNLDFVSSLKDKSLGGCGNPIIIIPWVVLNELNGIKDNKDGTKSENVIKRARHAIRFLYTMWKNKHPRIKGQNDTQDKKDFEKNQPALNWPVNDDRIIYCCIQLTNQIGKDKVILLSEDKNLLIRIMTMELQGCNTEELLSTIKVDAKADKTTQNPPKSFTCPFMSNVSLHDEVDSIMRSAFEVIRGYLKEFIESELIRTYGPNMWLNFIYKAPPWTLLDAVECILKHWGTIFAYVLLVNSKTSLEYMRDRLKESKGYIYVKAFALPFLDCSIAFFCQLNERHFNTGIVLQQLQNFKQQISDLKSVDDGPETPLKNFETVFSPLQARLNKSNNTPDSDNRVLKNFQYLWIKIFNHYTGLILDSLDYSHSFVYDKPDSVPLKSETFEFLPLIFPIMRAIRQSLRRILFQSDDVTQTMVKEYQKQLYNQFNCVSSTLKVPALPSNMTQQELETFCSNAHYREILVDAFHQLSKLFSTLQDSISKIKPEDSL